MWCTTKKGICILTYCHCGSGTDFKGWQLFIWSRNSLLLWNSKFIAVLNPPSNHIVNQLHPVPRFASYFSKILFNIIHTSMPRSPKWPPLFRFWTYCLAGSGRFSICTKESCNCCFDRLVDLGKFTYKMWYSILWPVIPGSKRRC
jgi:hypothetical protein